MPAKCKWGVALVRTRAAATDVEDTLDARTDGRPEEQRPCGGCAAGPTPATSAHGGSGAGGPPGETGVRVTAEEVRARFDGSREALEVGADRGRWRIEAAMKAWWRR